MLEEAVQKEIRRVKEDSIIRVKELRYLSRVANQYVGILQQEFPKAETDAEQLNILNALKEELENVRYHASVFGGTLTNERGIRQYRLAERLGWLKIEKPSKKISNLYLIEPTSVGLRLLNGLRKTTGRLSVEDEQEVLAYRQIAWTDGRTFDESNEELLEQVKSDKGSGIRRFIERARR